MSCDGTRCVRTADLVRSYTAPASYDFSLYNAEIRIAASEGASVLLTVNETATDNGSSTLCSGQTIVLTIRPADLDTLPHGSPVSDPWIGAFEVDITAPDGTITRLDSGSFVLEEGV